MYFCDILKHSDSKTPMSSAPVNPYLQTLMSLVDDLQDQMPEGKYLEAMNALRDLHSGKKPPPPPFVVPEGHVGLTDAEYNEYEAMSFRRRAQPLPAVLAVYRTTPALREACRWEGDHVLSEEQWVTYTGDRDPFIKRALILMAEEKIKEYNRHKNPKAIHCPFMARNADGKWYKPNLALVDSSGYDRCRWDCLCGSKNILCKNWRQHEVSDKHQAWERGGRQVSGHKVRKLRFRLRDETYLVEILGQEITWKQNHESNKPQSRNEWTNPEIFTGKPKDWVPPELPDPVMAYRRGNRTLTNATMPRTFPPLPRINIHQEVNRRPLAYMVEEDYARFLSMTE
jgi:hypothetical protein